MRTSVFIFSITCLASASLSASPDLDGVWVLDGPGTESAILLTEEGQKIQNEYDLLVDDPSLQCVPASASRVWANPNSRVKIEQLQDRILISYELFDLRREIPVGDESAIGDTPSTRNLSGTYFAEMGSSFAYYNGEQLIIESRNHAPGYIRTSRGVPQSPTTHTSEVLELVGDRLQITHTYRDETLYQRPLVLEYFFTRVDETEVLPYECSNADYDWFLELNNNTQGNP